MALNSINTNVAAYYAQANIGKASSAASSSIARLSSGNRIVRASDDVAAMSAGTSLRTNVTTLKRALINASQGSSLLQVADAALSQVTDILQRQKAIAVQAGSGSLRDTERSYLNQEFQNLSAEIDRIATSTNFNNVTLLNGGLGSKTRLANTDALAALMNPAGNGASAAVSTKAIEAFKTDGTSANGVGTAGFLQVTDSAGTALVGAAFDNVNTAVYGKFDSFKISNVVYGTSATITATMNGVEFSGTYASGTAVKLTNGSTTLNLGITAITLTNAGTVEAGRAAMAEAFSDTSIQRVSTVQGVDFSGTALKSVTGATTTGIAMVRLSSSSADISNFQYAGNAGSGTSILTVDINGQKFTATDVPDALAAADIITFQSDDGQALSIDFTGLATADELTDITTAKDQKALISSLNAAFSKAGSGLNFAVGSTTADTLRITISSASTNSLFNGQALDVASAASAAAASIALDGAIGKVTSVRAEVGALQSRFDFASSNIESAIQNQDAARGVLLDTDVATEATAYATSQVQLQAGISVLAQANQLPQNLLKLLG